MTTGGQDVLRDLERVAQQASRRMEHSWIGAEHLLFAACAADDVVALTLLRAGLVPRLVWNSIRDLVGVGEWAVDRDALAAVGIDLDGVLTAVPSPTRTAGGRGARRRRSGHRPLNAVATRCLAAADANLRLRPDTARASVARAVIDADSRTVSLVLQRIEVDVPRLRTALRPIA